MKKIIAILAALFMLAMASAAVADTGLTLVEEGMEIQLVDGSGLFNYLENGVLGICDIDGNIITEANFRYSPYAQGNLIIGMGKGGDDVNGMGAYLFDGTPAIPFEYGAIRHSEGNWAICYVYGPATEADYQYLSMDGSYYKYISVDLYNLNTGACMKGLSMDKAVDIATYNGCINVQDSAGNVTTYDEEFNVLATDLSSAWSSQYAVWEIEVFCENERYGLKDAAGNVIVEPTYLYIYPHRNGHNVIQNENGLGLVDARGNVVIEPVYDYVNSMYYGPLSATGEEYTYSINGYSSVEIDGKLGYADGQGLTCEPKYGIYDVQENGISAIYIDEAGNNWLISADGVETQIAGYQYFDPIMFMGGVYYRAYDENNMCGMVDWHGDVILPLEYLDIAVSGDGKYVCATKDFSTFDLYEVSYPQGRMLETASSAPVGEPAPAATAAEQAPATEAPVNDSVASALAAFLAMTSSVPAATTSETVVPEEPSEDPAEVIEVPVEMVEEAPVEIPAEENPAPQADTSAVRGMLDSVQVLLSLDPAANKVAAVELITAATAMLGDSNVSVTTLLNTAVTLLNTDAAANGAAVVSILSSAVSLL